MDQLLQTLKSLDPSQGDRLEDRPEIEVSRADLANCGRQLILAGNVPSKCGTAGADQRLDQEVLGSEGWAPLYNWIKIQADISQLSSSI